MSQINVAVLDDYQGFSDPVFRGLDSTKFKVTSYKETLLPYNDPDTPQSVKDELVKRLEPFEVICTMRERTPFPAELIARLPNLKLLLTTRPYNRSLDSDACKKQGIAVAGTDGQVAAAQLKAGPDSTTQHCVALILAIARDIARGDVDVKTGLWQTGSAISLSGKTLGVVGLGRLGARVAAIMSRSFGMRVVAWSANLTQEAADQKAAESGLPVHDANGEKTFKVVGREELFRTADVVSLHIVLSARSRGLITSEDLHKMKPSAFFVNSSRGPLVVEKDLLQCLREGRIRGAALDVFDIEPLPKDSEWRSTDWGKNGSSQVLLTPHMGYVEEDVLQDWYREQVENIQRWAAGEELAYLIV